MRLKKSEKMHRRKMREIKIDEAICKIRMCYGKDYFYDRIPLNFEKNVCNVKEYGEKVRFLREEKGRKEGKTFSQRELAEELSNFGLALERNDNDEGNTITKVNRDDIANIERGASINLRTLMLISEYFKCTIPYLLGKTNDPECGGSESYVFLLKPSSRNFFVTRFFYPRYGISNTIKIEGFNPRRPIKNLPSFDVEEILKIVRSEKNGIIISGLRGRDYLYYISKEQFMKGKFRRDPSPYLSMDFDYVRDFEIDDCQLTPLDANEVYPKNYTYAEVHCLIIEQMFKDNELDGLLIVQMCNERNSSGGKVINPINFFDPNSDDYYEGYKKLSSVFGIDRNDYNRIKNRLLLDYLYCLKNKLFLSQHDLIWHLRDLYNYDEWCWKLYMDIFIKLGYLNKVQMKYARKAIKKLLTARGHELEEFLEAINK